MVEPLPAKLPIWNTGGSNRTEPTAGEKVTGWAIDDEPPSSYFNWLQYYAGAWFTWLSERVNKGSGEHDLVVRALQPDTPGTGGKVLISSGAANTSGDGGDIELRAALGHFGEGGTIDINAGNSAAGVGGFVNIIAGDGGGTNEGGDVNIAAGAGDDFQGGDIGLTGGAADGTDNDGGNVGLIAGDSTGTGGSIIYFRVAEAGASGTGANVATEVCRFDGRAAQKYMRLRRHLRFETASDTGRGDFQLTAKAQPTAPVTGDTYLDNGSNQARVHDSVGYRALSPAYGVPFGSSFNATDAASEVAFTDTGPTPVLYTIPANYLSTGSRIKIWLGLSRLGSPVDEPGFNIRMGPVGSHAAPPTGTIIGSVAPVAGGATLDTFTVQAETYIIAAGSPGTAEALTLFTGAPSSLTWQSSSQHSDNTAGLSIDTGVALELFPTVNWNAVGGGGQWAIIRYFSIEVA